MARIRRKLAFGFAAKQSKCNPIENAHRIFAGALFFITCTSFFLTKLAFSTEINKSSLQTQDIPKPATADASPNCSRSYIYRNKVYPADSSRKPDGEGLRMILKKVPKSEQMLNDYQARIKALKWPAFTGTLGLATMISGLIYSAQIETQLGKHDTRLIMIGTGGVLLLSSYIYGYLGRRLNEHRLEEAVDTYNNSSNPEEKIQVNFTPTITDTGGVIKTIIPF